MAMKIKEPSMLFDERVGVCNVSLGLDKRNPDRAVDGQFPLCMRFTINYRKYYFCIGEKCSMAELARISKANGHGERKMDSETNFERQVRLQQLFQNYVHVVETLYQTGALTLDRIKTALTGRCESTSLISVWEGIIQEKIQAGKAGTAGSYNNALNCFKNLTGFTYKDGFSIDPTLVSNWVVSMGEHNYAAATQGIYLRACRVVVNRCIAEGHIMQKAYMFGKSRDKIKIPNGASRKGWYLTVEQMKELYNHWKANDLDFPIYDYKRTDNPPYAVKTALAAKLIHQSLAMFLMQYLSCGCNLVDLALMRYNRFYFDSDRKAFQFIRHKSEDETKDGEGMEVIVPIIEPMPYSMKCVINQCITLLMMSNGYFASSDSTAALRDLAMTVAKTLYVYSLLFVPEYLQQLYQKIVNEQEPLAYCVYYFVTFDHGLKEMARVFSWQMNGNEDNPMTCELLKLCLRMFVRHSLENETETKADWLRLAEKLYCEEAWKEIHYIAEQVKTHGGKHADQRVIDELLTGNVEQLKTFIADFLKENTSPCHLAYLLYALRGNEKIDNCDYITFHRAIQHLSDKPIGGPDVPQRRYNELLACPKLLNEPTDKWKRAKAIIDQLTEELEKL